LKFIPTKVRTYMFTANVERFEAPTLVASVRPDNALSCLRASLYLAERHDDTLDPRRSIALDLHLRQCGACQRMALAATPRPSQAIRAAPHARSRRRNGVARGAGRRAQRDV
jgi:hypothetical protein